MTQSPYPAPTTYGQAPQVDRPAAVAARSLVKSYGTGDTRLTVLDGLDVAFASGAFTSVMGPSGSGKSTLMHLLAGLDTADSGQIAIAGNVISGLSEKKLTKVRRDTIGFIFQSFNLVPAMTAKENILLPAKLAGTKIDPDYLAEITGLLGLDERLSHRPYELSGGQQQRVAVARALVNRPAVIFADEPTGNLDSTTGHEVLGLLRRAVDDYGQSVVMVTHDAAAAAVGDRVVLLKDGRLAGDIVHPTAEIVAQAMLEVTR